MVDPGFAVGGGANPTRAGRARQHTIFFKKKMDEIEKILSMRGVLPRSTIANRNRLIEKMSLRKNCIEKLCFDAKY